jgi:uncharacterized membrane protein
VLFGTAGGRIVGVNRGDGFSHGVVYTIATGTVVDLSQTLADPTLQSNALTVTHDDIGGEAESPDHAHSLPVLWVGSTTPVYLDTLGGCCGLVDAMNEKGDAVGVSQTTAGDVHCTFWPAAGGIVDCHPQGWGPESHATDLNAQGLFVGYALHPDLFTGRSRAFLGLPYGTILLPPLPGDTDSDATGITTLGDIIGASCNPNGCRPTAWVNGVPVDLTPRIANSQNWTHLSVFGISEDGWMVGLGVLRSEPFGEPHTLLFTPVDNATVAWYKWKYRIAQWYQARYDRWRKSIDWYYRERARAAQR